MNLCPKCFAPVPSDSQWCLQCGARLETESQSQNGNQQNDDMTISQIDAAWQVADSTETVLTSIQEGVGEVISTGMEVVGEVLGSIGDI